MYSVLKILTSVLGLFALAMSIYGFVNWIETLYKHREDKMKRNKYALMAVLFFIAFGLSFLFYFVVAVKQYSV